MEYKIDDMVMDRIQVNSNAKDGVVGKLSIEARGPFRIIEDHKNVSYSVKPFDKANGAIRRFMAQDIYALPPQILSCDDIEFPDLRYLNNDFAPVKHSFKYVFNIESYNSMWLDKSVLMQKLALKDICQDSIPVTDKVRQYGHALCLR